MNEIKNKEDLCCILHKLSNAPVECDGYARLAAHELTKANENFAVFIGLIKVDDEKYFEPHFWIEWEDHIIDFRARYWLGDSKDVPHGINPISEVGKMYIPSNDIEMGLMPEHLYLNLFYSH